MEKVGRQSTDLENGLYGLLQVTIVICAAFLNGAIRVIEGNFDTFGIVMLTIVPALTALAYSLFSRGWPTGGGVSALPCS